MNIGYPNTKNRQGNSPFFKRRGEVIVPGTLDEESNVPSIAPTETKSQSIDKPKFDNSATAKTGTTDFPTVKSRKGAGNTRKAGRGVAELAGYIPGLNIPAQTALAADDLRQGNLKSAAMNAAFAIPLVKPIAKAGKLIGKAGKYAKNLFNKGGTKVTNTAKPYIPKELPHYGDMRNPKEAQKIFDLTKTKGKMLDEGLPSDFQYKSSMFKKMPSVSGRQMVDFNPGIKGLPSQRFYKSTSLGGKKFASGASSKGHWVPLEGYGKSHKTNNWFIKSPGLKEGFKKGWDTGYGSQTYENMGKQINKVFWDRHGELKRMKFD